MKHRIVLWIILFVLIWLVINLINNTILRNYKKKHPIDNEPLPDILHQNFIDKRHYLVVEYIFYVILISLFLFCAFHDAYSSISEMILLLVIFYSIKLFCSIVTILPDPSGFCHKKRVLGGCNNLIPSGHVGTLFIIMFCLVPYMSISWKIIFSVVIMFYALCVIVVRNHYTIDVIMSWFVVYAIYHNLHPFIMGII